MSLQNMIYKLRMDAKLSQAELAELLNVSPQAVQKWESGGASPSLDKVVNIARRFGVSIDALVLDRDTRISEELRYNKKFQPKYSGMHEWELYSENLMTEYNQSIEEGLELEGYKALFEAVSKMPRGENKKRMADVLFDIVINAPQKKGYLYNEPSQLDEIRALRRRHEIKADIPDGKILADKIYGAWMGRVCGCLLGKPFEGVRTNELIPFLKDTGNYPLHRYLLSSDVTEGTVNKYKYTFRDDWGADVIDGMPIDDDTNYTVLGQMIVEKYGRNFTPYDVSRAWIDYQSKNAYCTAERVAFCNFIKGYEPPQSAKYKNPFREWIGAQIRADYFGYINPGAPELAAEMAFRDASISHTKNGIYGEMLVAAMLACAAVTSDIKEIILGGLGEIPSTSRLYKDITDILEGYESGVAQKECFANIHKLYDEYTAHGWCHTISNAMIVVAALLYGNGDFGRSICMAVETGFDTDCNGATVGSILGMRNGINGIGEEWKAPLKDNLHTSIFGVGTVSVKERAEMTLKHVKA